MTTPDQKLVQYLAEARASEHALTRVLQAQIAMTPHGSYRSLLEQHLTETKAHADRVGERIKALDGRSNPVTAVIGFWEDMLGQTVAVGKSQLDLLRGSGGDEKVLKNAKDTCATESLEIATYAAIEALARRLDDEPTARLAAEIRAEEERMLDSVLRELPRLTGAVVGAEIDGEPSYDVTETGVADAIRDVVDPEPPFAGYDDLTAEQITERLPGVSQADLVKVETYERRGPDRTTVLARVQALRGDEPWAGYDEQTVDEVRQRLSEADEDRLAAVRAYERGHKDRVGVLRATERGATTA
jgi:ferritin-like metal-binding protein YciE